MNFEIVKNNALNEIKDLTKNKIIEELSKAKLNNKIENDKLKELSEKILTKNIQPIFLSVINENKKIIENKIEEYKKEGLSDEDLQWKINDFINSKLSIWKKTVLNTKILFVIKEIISYIKYTTTIEKNYKKQLKNEKKLKQLISKYKLS